MIEEIVKKCASCFVIHDNKILLVYHKKFNKYLQPGGHVEDGEEFYAAAIREVFEETGITIDIKDKHPFNVEQYDTTIGKQLDYQFIGIPLNFEIKDSDESYSSGWFKIDNLDDIDVIDDLKDKIEMIKRR